MPVSFTVNKLQATNFRNIKDSVYEFGPNINCIFGGNGNGKTNILEAIHIVLTRKSFRKNVSFEQLLSTDCEKPSVIINCMLRYDDEFHQKSARFDQSSKHFEIDGRKSNNAHYSQLTNAIFIGPFDSNNFFNNSTDRRDWMDYQLCKLDGDFKSNYDRYVKTLKFRNLLLKKKPSNYLSQLNAIKTQFAESSLALTSARERLISQISPFLAKIYYKIFAENALLDMRLNKSINAQGLDPMLKAFDAAFEKDLILGHTTNGAHRDDYDMLFNRWSALDYCSLGQLKMAYLALIFAYIELFRYKFSCFPLLIIDDVSGELDKDRWRKLISYLSDCPFQIFITTANDGFREELKNLKNAKYFEVNEGEIIPQ